MTAEPIASASVDPHAGIAVCMVIPCYRSTGARPELARRIAAQVRLFGRLGVVQVYDASYLLRSSAVQSFTFLAAVVTLFSGVQLFCLGIISECLALIYYHTMDRPPYLVRETVGVLV